MADAGSGHITFFMVVAGLCVTGVIIGFDAVIISHIPINREQLDSAKVNPLGKLSRTMLVLRLAIAVVMVGVFTIPTLLFFFQRETTSDLASENGEAVAYYMAHGAPARLQAQINKLTNQEHSTPTLVNSLESQAAALDSASATNYQLALQDSDGNGLSHLPGCPINGDCWNLQQESKQEAAQAATLRQQATNLQSGQAQLLSNDASQIKHLTAEQNKDISTFSEAQKNDTGLGARTQALISLAVKDPYGIGLSAAIVLAVAALLELAVIGIKVTASRNSEYELTTARAARGLLRADQEVDVAATVLTQTAVDSLLSDPEIRQSVFEQKRREVEQALRPRNVGSDRIMEQAIGRSRSDLETSRRRNWRRRAAVPVAAAAVVGLASVGLIWTVEGGGKRGGEHHLALQTSAVKTSGVVALAEPHTDGPSICHQLAGSLALRQLPAAIEIQPGGRFGPEDRAVIEDAASEFVKLGKRTTSPLSPGFNSAGVAMEHLGNPAIPSSSSVAAAQQVLTSLGRKVQSECDFPVG